MVRKSSIIALLAVTATALAPSMASARPTEPVTVAVAATCVNGMADIYPCKNIDLLSNLPLANMGGGNGSGGWGWTDPSNGKEYAIVGRTTGTSFVDISNPTTPVFLGNLPSATGTSTWRELWVHNNTAYIISDNNGAHGMQIFDLTRLRSVTSPPVTFSADARDTSFTNAHTININPATGFAYVNGSNTCGGGPRVFNLANRLAPAFVGCVSGDGYSHDSQAIVYHGPDTRFSNREILVGSNEDTVTVWDVTTKSSPQMLARKGYTGRGYTHQGWFTEDHRFFLLDDETDETSFGHNTRTRVLNVANLTNPTLLGFFTGPTTATDHNQFVKGNFSYQSNYRAGLRIIDLTNVANPPAMSEAAFFDVDPTSNAAGFAGTWTNYPYYPSGVVAVFSIQRGLFVVRPRLPSPNRVFFDDGDRASGRCQSRRIRHRRRGDERAIAGHRAAVRRHVDPVAVLVPRSWQQLVLGRLPPGLHRPLGRKDGRTLADRSCHGRRRRLDRGDREPDTVRRPERAHPNRGGRCLDGQPGRSRHRQRGDHPAVVGSRTGAAGVLLAGHSSGTQVAVAAASGCPDAAGLVLASPILDPSARRLRTWISASRSAGHRDHLPGDAGVGRRAQIDDRAGNLGGVEQPAERGLGRCSVRRPPR